MIDPNPYASPQAESRPETLPTGPVGAWREGDLLVMHRQAALPPYCVFTNEPAGGEPLNLAYSQIGEHGTPELGPTVHIALIGFPVTPEIPAEFFRANVGGLLSLLGGVGLVALACLSIQQGLVTLFFVGMALGLGLMLFAGYLSYARRKLTLERMNDEYLWFRGAAPGFLDRLGPPPFAPTHRRDE